MLHSNTLVNLITHNNPRGAFILKNIANESQRYRLLLKWTTCLPVPGLHSYLLAVGLECGRILLYTWHPGRQTVDRRDWNACGQTDISYPFQETKSSRIRLLSGVAMLLSPFITHPPTDKATLWRSRDSAGGPRPVGQVETAARKTDSPTRGVKLSGRAPGSSWPAPVPTTLSKSSTSTNGLFSTANTDTITSLLCGRTLGLKATGRSVAPWLQLLAGKPLTPCDSQLRLGSVAAAILSAQQI